MAFQEYDFQKVGRPSYHWWGKGIKQYWDFLRTTYFKCYQSEGLAPINEKHIEAARRMAEQYKHMEFREMHSVRWDDVMAKYKPSDEYTTQKRMTWQD